ncbi:hypothetical protein G5V59_23715 [Nocardioides sp. W3-2-3]|nr:hypothetical protein [Nocardioides convexus]
MGLVAAGVHRRDPRQRPAALLLHRLRRHAGQQARPADRRRPGHRAEGERLRRCAAARRRAGDHRHRLRLRPGAGRRHPAADQRPSRRCLRRARQVRRHLASLAGCREQRPQGRRAEVGRARCGAQPARDRQRRWLRAEGGRHLHHHVLRRQGHHRRRRRGHREPRGAHHLRRLHLSRLGRHRGVLRDRHPADLRRRPRYGERHRGHGPDPGRGRRGDGHRRGRRRHPRHRLGRLDRHRRQRHRGRLRHRPAHRGLRRDHPAPGCCGRLHPHRVVRRCGQRQPQHHHGQRHRGLLGGRHHVHHHRAGHPHPHPDGGGRRPGHRRAGSLGRRTER